jgi:hypothetical protein
MMRMRFLRWLGGSTALVACGYGCGSTAGAAGSPAKATVGAAMDASAADEEAGDSFGTPLPDLPFPITNDPGDSGPGTVAIDDAASAVDPSAAYSVTLTMSPFTVEPNHEVYKCQDFANPFAGQAVDIHRYDLDMNEGSHHMNLFYNQGATDGNVVDCPNGGFQQGPNTFGAQSPKASQTYPDGVGAAIPAGTGFTMNAHYVNSGSTPIQAAVKVTMFVAKPGLTTQHAGVVSFILTSITIPPTGQPYPVSGTCAIPQDMNVIFAGSHMHQRATAFTATTGATTLYETTAWSDPPSKAFSPPLALAANSNVTWTCTYVNDTGSPLVFGQSALTNAMCNFGATFYPVADPSNPVISCLK